MGGVVVAKVVVVVRAGHQRLDNVVFSLSVILSVLTTWPLEDASISDHQHTEAKQGIPKNNSAI